MTYPEYAILRDQKGLNDSVVAMLRLISIHKKFQKKLKKCLTCYNVCDNIKSSKGT